MDCATVRAFLYPFIDGKTSLAENLEVQEHLDKCVNCYREYLLEKAVTRELANEVLWEEAPPDLWGWIEGAIREWEEKEPILRKALSGARRLRVVGMTLILGVLIAVAMSGQVNTSSLVAARAIMDHRQFIKLGKGPTIPVKQATDLSATFAQVLGAQHMTVPEPRPGRGMELLGGRLCFIEGKRGGVAIYRFGERVLSFHVLSQPLAGDEELIPLLHNGHTFYMAEQGGYRALLFRMSGSYCLLVSDLPDPEAASLAASFLERG